LVITLLPLKLAIAAPAYIGGRFHVVLWAALLLLFIRVEVSI
jgi:hypothetical protein